MVVILLAKTLSPAVETAVAAAQATGHAILAYAKIERSPQQTAPQSSVAAQSLPAAGASKREEG